jgi:hypothetical protein
MKFKKLNLETKVKILFKNLKNLVKTAISRSAINMIINQLLN